MVNPKQPQPTKIVQDDSPDEPDPERSQTPEIMSQEIEEIQSQDLFTDTPPAPPAKKKRSRTSKKDIPEYSFTPAQVLEVADFVATNPELYDKTHARWMDPNHKTNLWKEIAAKFEGATHQQVKKLFDNRRTEYGRIEKKENKSGAPRRKRTKREETIMETWGFLKGHIAHEQTTPSDTFSQATAASPDLLSDADSDLSAHSIARRRALHSATPTTPVRGQIQRLVDHAAQQLEKQMTPREREVDAFLNMLRYKLAHLEDDDCEELQANMMVYANECSKRRPLQHRQAMHRRMRRAMDSSVSHMHEPQAPPPSSSQPSTPAATQIVQAAGQSSQYQHGSWPPSQTIYQPQFQTVPVIQQQIPVQHTFPPMSPFSLPTISPVKDLRSMTPSHNTPQALNLDEDK